jgi:hypothetical protein
MFSYTRPTLLWPQLVGYFGNGQKIWHINKASNYSDFNSINSNYNKYNVTHRLQQF